VETAICFNVSATLRAPSRDESRTCLRESLRRSEWCSCGPCEKTGPGSLASYPCMMVSLLFERRFRPPHYRRFGLLHLTTEVLHPVNNEGSDRHLSAAGAQRRCQELPVSLGGRSPANAPAGAIGTLPATGNGAELNHDGSAVGAWATYKNLAALAIANHTSLPLLDRAAGKADIFHVSSLVRNPPRRPLLTATLHDLTTWIMPELHLAANRRPTITWRTTCAGRTASSQSRKRLGRTPSGCCTFLPKRW
jgi:hypothetical protein